MALSLARFCFLTVILAASSVPGASSAGDSPQQTDADAALAAYFNRETGLLSAACSATTHTTLPDWEARRPELRREAAEMLGLDPLPPRTELSPVITGTLDSEGFRVEKLYFQSSPHLYVTANLYVPKSLSKPAPAVLYLCGHSPVISNGVSYGNKTAYQDYGIWFARNGFVCLILDTLQWGEIPGHHWGTYSEGQWWWNSRGYTPAGVETWNALRALDYLRTRPEVDAARIGVTGRSGGGAYSWFVAALDDRIKVVAPVAGITDLRNYVVDGGVDNHCDCMFFVNTYRWDYPLLAALAAPRELLLVNTDADSLFPLDGVMRVRSAIKSVYDLYSAAGNFGLVIGPGPHRDGENLQVPVFKWFKNRLERSDAPIELTHFNEFPPAALKVFDKIPEDQINTTIQDSFVPAAAAPKVPGNAAEWRRMREDWMRSLRAKCFAGWPANAAPPAFKLLRSSAEAGVRYEIYSVETQAGVDLRLYLIRPRFHKPSKIRMEVADEFQTATDHVDTPGGVDEIRNVFGQKADVDQLIGRVKKENLACTCFMPRGVGPDAWSGGPGRETQIRRRFMLLGMTLDGMRVWDIRRAVQAAQLITGSGKIPVQLSAQGNMGVNALYASLFEPEVAALELRRLPVSHKEGPDYLNVLKYLDIPEAAAMAAERCESHLQFQQTQGLDFLRAMSASSAANLRLTLEE